MVTEFMEGETLAERIEKGPIPSTRHSINVGAILSADPAPMAVKPFTRPGWNGSCVAASIRIQNAATSPCAKSYSIWSLTG